MNPERQSLAINVDFILSISFDIFCLGLQGNGREGVQGYHHRLRNQRQGCAQKSKESLHEVITIFTK